MQHIRPTTAAKPPGQREASGGCAALRLADKAASLSLSDPDILFRLALLYADLERLDDTVLFLDKAVENGFCDFEKINKDPRLKIARSRMRNKNIRP